MSSPDLALFDRFPLKVGPVAVQAIRDLRALPKFDDLPGMNTAEERRRCTALVDELLDRISSGIAKNPRKSWVLEQCLPTLVAATHEDTEARERFGPYLEQLLDILGIDSSDGMLNFYLAFGGIDAA